MKKALILLLFLELFAFDTVTASKIFDKIFHAMVKKENISVYTVDEIYKEVIAITPTLYLNDNYEEADIILVNDFSEIPESSSDKLIFTTSYPVFRDTDYAVGAFYWDRGHIKIEFSKRKLRDKNILLPSSFEKYIKDDE